MATLVSGRGIGFKISDWTTNKFRPQNEAYFCNLANLLVTQWQICSLLMSLEDIHLYEIAYEIRQWKSVLEIHQNNEKGFFNACYCTFLCCGTFCCQGPNAYLQTYSTWTMKRYQHCQKRNSIMISPANEAILIIDGFISFLLCFEFQAKECQWKNFLQPPEWKIKTFRQKVSPKTYGSINSNNS